VPDGLDLLTFDFVDLGVPLATAQAVPAVVKSLAFLS
jgi:hypothetical protein